MNALCRLAGGELAEEEEKEEGRERMPRERGEKWAGTDGKSKRRNPGLCTGET